MQYVTHRSHRMQNPKFGVMCPVALFMETALGPPEHEKKCIDVSHPRRIRMHYVTRRSHRMQNQKIGITSPSALFLETAPGPPKPENSASMFHAPDTPEYTT
jgi:hypothetical protein